MGISKVVNNIKKMEIPSMPTTKFKFALGIHNNLLTNWNELTESSKKTHSNKDTTNVKQEIFKTIFFKTGVL
jgi:hypothetical protein